MENAKINEIAELLRSLSPEKAHQFAEKLLSVASPYANIYDYEYEAHSKAEGYDIGDEMPLSELIEAGFNKIKLYDSEGEYLDYGYNKDDLSKYLDAQVEITNYCRDDDGYLYVCTRIIDEN